MKKLISLLAIILIASSCSDIYEPKESEYLITSGQHDSRVIGGFASDKVRTLKSNNFSFTARFDESARYDLGNKNQYDINKNRIHHSKVF